MTCFHDSPGAQRRGRSRLDNDSVAANQGGRHFPARNGARKIPWSHQANDADGFTNREHVDALALGWNQKTGQSRSLAAEVAEDIDGPANFTLRFGKRRAVLAC